MHHCDYLQHAWNAEIDKSVFEFQMFIYCKENDLISMEQSCFDIMRPEYNTSKIAGRTEHTEEFKKHMRNIMTGRIVSRETRDKISFIASQKIGKLNPFYGKSHSEKTKKTLASKASNRLASGHPMKGKKASKEAVERLKETIKGKRDGIKNGNCKLSEEEVYYIKKSKEKIRILADIFKISESQVKRIRYGKAWALLDKEQSNG